MPAQWTSNCIDHPRATVGISTISAEWGCRGEVDGFVIIR
jgi:hypothetical protein